MLRLLTATAALAVLAIAHHNFREIKCTTSSGSLRGGPEKSKCHMVLKHHETDEGRPVPDGVGFFTEKTDKGEEREYIDLVCPKAHTVFNAYLDQGHRACFNFYTYQLEQRGDEWYMWRSGKCLNSTANFRVGCKFDEKGPSFEEQFPDDNQIFSRLRARAAKRRKF